MFTPMDDSAVTSASAPATVDIECMLSHDARPSRDIRKIDATGAYLPFDCVTIIMQAHDINPFVTRTDTPSQAAIYQRLEQLLSDGRAAQLGFSPLLRSSWHVTLAGILTRSQCHSFEQYNQFVKDRVTAWTQLKQMFAMQTTHPIVRFTVRVETAPLLHLLLTPKTADDEAALTRWTNVTRAVLGAAYHTQPAWHMTLAYPFTSRLMDKDKLGKLAQSLTDLFRGVDVGVSAPKLCVSKSMNDFRPI